MKKNRIFISSLKNNFLFLICGWAVIHLIGWWYNLGSGIISPNLLMVTFSITILLSLILSTSGKNNGEISFELPFINSYTKQEDNFEFKPGGFNIFIRSMYFIVAIFLLITNLQFGGSVISDWLGIIFGILIIGFAVISYLSNKNDFLILNSNCISWYDNEQKEKISVEWHMINKYSVINYSSDKGNIIYPEKIVFNTSEKEFSLNMKTMSILPYSQIVIGILESQIGVKD